MTERFRRWFRRWFRTVPKTGADGGEGPKAETTKPPPVTSVWVLGVRPPMGPRPAVEGGVYEWFLTLITPRQDRVCRIDGVSFFVRCDKTVAASRTIERMRRTQALTRSELTALIDEHRVTGSPVYLQRRFDAVERTEQFRSGADEALHEALEWGGIGRHKTSGTDGLG